MPQPQLIALYSPSMGSGKSTVSQLLDTRYGYTVLKFAATMKRMVGVLLEDLGIPPKDLSRYLEGDLKERHLEGLGVTPRRMMQTLGNEWAKEYIDSGLWVALAMRKVNRLVNTGKRAVVDDMRFPDEYNALRSVGARMVKVVRPGTVSTNNHRSEGLLNDNPWDDVVVNDGSFDDLAEKVFKLLY